MQTCKMKPVESISNEISFKLRKENNELEKSIALWCEGLQFHGTVQVSPISISQITDKL